jgi:hypothetical protein
MRSVSRILCVAGGWAWHFQFHKFCSSSPAVFQCCKSQLLYTSSSYETSWFTGTWWVYAGCNSWQLCPQRQGWAFALEVRVCVCVCMCHLHVKVTHIMWLRNRIWDRARLHVLSYSCVRLVSKLKFCHFRNMCDAFRWELCIDHKGFFIVVACFVGCCYILILFDVWWNPENYEKKKTRGWPLLYLHRGVWIRCRSSSLLLV